MENSPVGVLISTLDYVDAQIRITAKYDRAVTSSPTTLMSIAISKKRDDKRRCMAPISVSLNAAGNETKKSSSILYMFYSQNIFFADICWTI